MNIEIEAKLKVESLEDVKRKLVELGAEFTNEKLQRDFYFDDTKRTLTKTDRCLRLRREVIGNSDKFLLTYKGAKEKGSFKKRQEIEIEISDADSARKLLSILGYKKVLVVEKKRRVWRLGDCEIALDRLPLLGDFVEIEGPDDEKIADARRSLGLADLPHITESYASLVAKKQIVDSK